MNEVRLLKREDIEVKIKQVFEKGAVALLYKTARTDMQILDETYGPLNWETDYKEIKGNLYCGIGVDNGERVVWKWDCGIESREDGEGNEKKGEASDAFKRAGFKWGIGRELYTAPFIFIKCETTEKNGKYYLKDKFAKYEVGDIDYDDKRNIVSLEIVDGNDSTVFKYGRGKNEPKILPTSHEDKKVDKIVDKGITYEQALNMGFKDKDGNLIKLAQLNFESLSRLAMKKEPEWKELANAANIIIESEARQGIEDEQGNN